MESNNPESSKDIPGPSKSAPKRSRTEFTCSICNLSFDVQFELFEHLQRLHENEPAYWCIQCYKAISRLPDLIQHMRTCKGKKRFMYLKCSYPDCTFKTPDGRLFCSHLDDSHNELSVKTCHLCQIDFSSPFELVLHLQNTSCKTKKRGRRPMSSAALDAPSTSGGNVVERRSTRPRAAQSKISYSYLNDDCSDPDDPVCSKKIKKSPVKPRKNISKAAVAIAVTIAKKATVSPPIQPNRTIRIVPSGTSRARINAGRNPTFTIPASGIIYGIPKDPWKAWQTRIGNLRTEQCRQEMQAEGKLLDFFKCMCHLCQFTTNDSEFFRIHILDDHSTNNEVFCLYCLTLHKVPNPLVDHMIQKHRNMTYQCSNCLYRACSKTHIKYHNKVIHPNMKMEFVICEPVKGLSEEEQVLVDDNKICKIGGCKCPHNLFLEHAFHELSLNSDNSVKYICIHCQKEFADAKLLFDHRKEHENSKYSCQYCIFGSENQDDLFAHLCLIHPHLNFQMYGPSESPKAKEKKPKNSKNKRTIETNLNEAAIIPKFVKNHLNEFKCGFMRCPDILRDLADYEVHVQRDHYTNVCFPCPHCDLAFAPTMAEAENHIQLHGPILYQCNKPNCGLLDWREGILSHVCESETCKGKMVLIRKLKAVNPHKSKKKGKWIKISLMSFESTKAKDNLSDTISQSIEESNFVDKNKLQLEGEKQVLGDKEATFLKAEKNIHTSKVLLEKVSQFENKLKMTEPAWKMKKSNLTDIKESLPFKDEKIDQKAEKNMLTLPSALVENFSEAETFKKSEPIERDSIPSREELEKSLGCEKDFAHSNSESLFLSTEEIPETPVIPELFKNSTSNSNLQTDKSNALAEKNEKGTKDNFTLNCKENSTWAQDVTLDNGLDKSSSTNTSSSSTRPDWFDEGDNIDSYISIIEDDVNSFFEGDKGLQKDLTIELDEENNILEENKKESPIITLEKFKEIFQNLYYKESFKNEILLQEGAQIDASTSNLKNESSNTFTTEEKLEEELALDDWVNESSSSLKPIEKLEEECIECMNEYKRSSKGRFLKESADTPTSKLEDECIDTFTLDNERLLHVNDLEKESSVSFQTIDNLEEAMETAPLDNEIPEPSDPFITTAKLDQESIKPFTLDNRVPKDDLETKSSDSFKTIDKLEGELIETFNRENKVPLGNSTYSNIKFLLDKEPAKSFPIEPEVGTEEDMMKNDSLNEDVQKFPLVEATENTCQNPGVSLNVSQETVTCAKTSKDKTTLQKDKEIYAHLLQRDFVSSDNFIINTSEDEMAQDGSDNNLPEDILMIDPSCSASKAISKKKYCSPSKNESTVHNYCIFCKRSFKKIKGLKLHLSKVCLGKSRKIDKSNNTDLVLPFITAYINRIIKSNSTASVLGKNTFLYPVPYRTLTMDSQYKCNMCYYKTKSCSFIQLHVFKHLGYKSYKCQCCFKMFYTEFQLKSHFKMHPNQKITVSRMMIKEVDDWFDDKIIRWQESCTPKTHTVKKAAKENMQEPTENLNSNRLHNSTAKRTLDRPKKTTPLITEEVGPHHRNPLKSVVCFTSSSIIGSTTEPQIIPLKNLNNLDSNSDKASLKPAINQLSPKKSLKGRIYRPIKRSPTTFPKMPMVNNTIENGCLLNKIK